MAGRATIAAAILLAVALPACSHATPPPAEPPVPVRTAAVRLATFEQRLPLTGTVMASRTATIGAAATGTVVAVDVQVGDHVAAGQVVAQIDPSRYRADLAQAQGSRAAAGANERAAQAQLETAQSRLHLAGVTASRMSQLYQEGAISKQRFDEVQTDLAAASSGVAQARAAVAAASDLTGASAAGVAAARVPLRETTVVAPFAGIVTSRMAEAGAVVGGGSPILTVEDESSLEIDTAVPEESLPSLATTNVVVSIDALGGRTIPARIRAIVPNANPALRSATVKISIPPTPGLIAGMFARITIPGSTHRSIAVPAAALVTRAGQDGVFVIRDGRARFVPVQAGSVEGHTLQVQGPLQPGQAVAVEATERLTDGTSVRSE